MYRPSSDGTGQPLRPMPGHHRRGGLLQRFVGEKPAGHVQSREFPDGLAAQQSCLDKHARTITEP